MSQEPLELAESIRTQAHLENVAVLAASRTIGLAVEGDSGMHDYPPTEIVAAVS